MRAYSPLSVCPSLSLWGQGWNYCLTKVGLQYLLYPYKEAPEKGEVSRACLTPPVLLHFLQGDSPLLHRPLCHSPKTAAAQPVRLIHPRGLPAGILPTVLPYWMPLQRTQVRVQAATSRAPDLDNRPAISEPMCFPRNLPCDAGPGSCPRAMMQDEGTLKTMPFLGTWSKEMDASRGKSQREGESRSEYIVCKNTYFQL